MVTYSHPPKGYKFTLTQAGLEMPRIRAKFDINNVAQYKSSLHCVPKSWIEKGYVTVVKEGD